MRSKIRCISLALLLCGTIVFSQTRRDLASWSSLELGYRINNNWKLGLEGQFRLKENLNTIDQYLAEFTVKRRILKDFDVAGGIRYTRENDNQGNIQGYENHLRLHADAIYKNRFGDFVVGFRLRYQNRGEFGASGINDNANVQRVRFKTSAEYKIKDWPLDPEVSAELFSRFERNEASRIDRLRVTMGTQYDIKKAGSIGAFWRIERSLGEEITDNLYIIGLSYSYTFKN